MRLQQYLDEKYLKKVESNVGGVNSTEVFVNPSWKELMEISDKGKDDIRFGALNSKKKIYVWNAFSALHDEISSGIGYKDWKRNDDLIEGIAIKKGSSFVAMNSDQLDELSSGNYSADIDEILSKDWSWTKKYKIDLENLVDTYREIRGL